MVGVVQHVWNETRPETMIILNFFQCIKCNVHDSDKTCRCWNYHIVFKECAKSVDQVGIMGEVFIVLADLIEGQSFDHLVTADTCSPF